MESPVLTTKTCPKCGSKMQVFCPDKDVHYSCAKCAADDNHTKLSTTNHK